MIAVCYCQYAPKPSPLIPVPSARIAIDSFGGDEAAYQQYLESNAKSEIIRLEDEGAIADYYLLKFITL
ncbi:hypothetical protein QUB47_21575 [Microcoleus sp. AT9_B5]